MHNSALVIGPDGAVITRYDQLSAASPFQPGADAAAMWFRVKGVPAVVTLGRDALWTELAELAAVAGTQIHVHLDHDSDDSPEASLRRLQVGANMASYRTLTVTANVVNSMIWDDLRSMDESRAEVHRLPRPDSGPEEVYSPFSANLVARAGRGQHRHPPDSSAEHLSSPEHLEPQSTDGGVVRRWRRDHSPEAKRISLILALWSRFVPRDGSIACRTPRLKCISATFRYHTYPRLVSTSRVKKK